jgi:hypothetical protein
MSSNLKIFVVLEILRRAILAKDYKLGFRSRSFAIPNILSILLERIDALIKVYFR